MEGELSNRSQLALPALAAVGGMAAPAVIYWLLNHDDPVALQGWAIPAATDIAFALGVLALLGSRIPQSLKMFLLTLAILDDLGAIIIIALFYTDNLSLASLAVAGGALRYVLEPLPLGIALGLVIGKVVGVFGMTALAIGSRLARMPEGASWTSLLGVSMLCGIGFTMPLFIANLAFGDDAPQHAVSAVFGVLVGSVCAAMFGHLLLRFTSARPRA